MTRRPSALFLCLALAPAAVRADPAAAVAPVRTQAQWEEVVRQQPENEEALFQLGTLLTDAEKTDEALKLLEKAAALAPGDARVQEALGTAYGLAAQKASVFSKFGLARKCQAAFENAVRLDPRAPEYRKNLMTYDLMAPAIVGGGKDKALVQAKALLDLRPLDGHRALGQVYIEEEKYPEAVAEYQAAIHLDPKDYGSLYGLGKVAAVSGQGLELGLASLQACLALATPAGYPPHAAVHWRIGNLHERQNQGALARADYQAALQDDPKFQQAQDALEKLPPP